MICIILLCTFFFYSFVNKNNICRINGLKKSHRLNNDSNYLFCLRSIFPKTLSMGPFSGGGRRKTILLVLSILSAYEIKYRFRNIYYKYSYTLQSTYIYISIYIKTKNTYLVNKILLPTYFYLKGKKLHF